jgi:hypothetical protein
MPHRPDDADANEHDKDDQSRATPSAPPHHRIAVDAHCGPAVFPDLISTTRFTSVAMRAKQAGRNGTAAVSS